VASSDATVSLAGISSALSAYLLEVQRDHVLCRQNEKKSAVHEKGKSLQIYRMYQAKAEIMDRVRFAAKSLRSWEKLPCWKHCGVRWDKSAAEVAARVEAHAYQNALLTQRVIWEQRPILIHAYKFEPDTHMKIELLPMKCLVHELDNPLKEMASVLRCHDYPRSLVRPTRSTKRTSPRSRRTSPRRCRRNSMRASVYGGRLTCHDSRKPEAPAVNIHIFFLLSP
jgi:hypothetical protein